MSQSVWATSKASKRSRGQAQRRNPITFTEEPKSKKTRIEDQDKSEETRREIMRRSGLQPSSGALVRRSPPSVPRMVISELAMLPTQPAPALEYYADSLHDQSLRRSSATNCVSIEHALSKFNKDPMCKEYLNGLVRPRAENGQTVIETCSNLIRLQEGFSAIGSLAQHHRKFCALVIAVGVLTSRVGARAIPLTFAGALKYFMVVLGQGSQFTSRMWRAIVDTNEYLVPGMSLLPFLHRISGELKNSKLASYAYTKMVGEAIMWNTRAMRQLGNVFWERVGSLALRMPEVDDIATQVGLMGTVLVDAQVLCSHSMSDAEFHDWSQDIALRSVISLTEFSVQGYIKILHEPKTGARNTNG